MITNYFTFGHGQENYGKYVTILAEDENEARELMFKQYGDKWAFQYPEKEYEEAIARWNYERLDTLISGKLPLWWFHKESESYFQLSFDEATDETKKTCKLIGFPDIETEEELIEKLKEL